MKNLLRSLWFELVVLLANTIEVVTLTLAIPCMLLAFFFEYCVELLRPQMEYKLRTHDEWVRLGLDRDEGDW